MHPKARMHYKESDLVCSQELKAEVVVGNPRVEGSVLGHGS